MKFFPANIKKIVLLFGLSSLISLSSLTAQIKVTQHKLKILHEENGLVYKLKPDYPVLESTQTNSEHQLCATFSHPLNCEESQLISLEYQIKNGSELGVNGRFGKEVSVLLAEANPYLIEFNKGRLDIKNDDRSFDLLELLSAFQLDQDSQASLLAFKELQLNLTHKCMLAIQNKQAFTNIVLVGIDQNKEFCCFSISLDQPALTAMKSKIEQIQASPASIERTLAVFRKESTSLKLPRSGSKLSTSSTRGIIF
jgi:hypothetical protein